MASEMKRIAKRLWRFPSRIRARFKSSLAIEYDGLSLNYSTRSPISKRWFYPRYISGDRLHEPPISALIRSELSPDSIFFDVGSNLGFFTVLAANICTASGGAVHAFELDPSLIPLIEESLRLNEGHGWVLLNCVACGEEEGHFHNFQAAQEKNPSTNQIVLSGGEQKETSTQVMSTTLDHYCRRTGVTPDLIKMDIEGAEALAVFGMLKVVKEIAPKLILEVHPETVRELGKQPMSLVRQLRERGEYETVVRIMSYRSDRDRQIRRLNSMDTDLFEKNHPIVLFFTSDPIDGDLRA